MGGEEELDRQSAAAWCFIIVVAVACVVSLHVNTTLKAA